MRKTPDLAVFLLILLGNVIAAVLSVILAQETRGCGAQNEIIASSFLLAQTMAPGIMIAVILAVVRRLTQAAAGKYYAYLFCVSVVGIGVSMLIHPAATSPWHNLAVFTTPSLVSLSFCALIGVLIAYLSRSQDQATSSSHQPA